MNLKLYEIQVVHHKLKLYEIQVVHHKSMFAVSVYQFTL